MKKTAGIFACILFLAAFALFAYAQNETESNANVSNATIPAASPVQPPVAKAPVDPNCNNNKLPEAGENCFSCPSDVKCKSGEQCPETGVCKGNINYTTYIILGIGAFLFIGVIIFARRFVFKKPKEELKPAQPPVQQQEPMQMPPEQDEADQRRESLLPPEFPSSNQAEIPAQQPMDQEFPLMPEPVNEHPGETDAQKFIRQMREKGWNDERIRMKMKEAGWSETQIALVFLRAPKFVKKY